MRSTVAETSGMESAVRQATSWVGRQADEYRHGEQHPLAGYVVAMRVYPLFVAAWGWRRDCSDEVRPPGCRMRDEWVVRWYEAGPTDGVDHRCDGRARTGSGRSALPERNPDGPARP